MRSHRRSGLSDERRRHRDAEEHGRMLVLEAEPEERAEDEPPPRVVALDDADEAIDAPHPEQRLERVHGQHAVDGQVNGRRDDRQAGQRLREHAASEPPRDQHGERDQHRARHRREDTKCDERAAQGQRRARDEGDQGRVVDVAKGQVPAAVEEVHLVAEIAVSVGEQEMKDELEAGQRRQQRTIQDGAGHVTMVRGAAPVGTHVASSTACGGVHGS